MNFEDLIAKVKTCGKQKLAVAAAEDDAVLEAVDAAHKQGIADAILVGDEAAIRKIAAELNIDLSDYEIINEPDKVQASLKAVKLAHDGVANMYMKGLLDTKTFLKSVLDKEVGLRTGNTLSHVAVFEVKGIEQLLFLTDVAFMTYPTLEDKVHIIENTVAVAHACGVECPKVAPLAAVEVVNPKMPCTVDADELRKMNAEGKITGCVVDGPLSMDIAIDPEAAHHKGAQDRPAAGHADILLFPDIQAGNLVYKTLVHTADCKNGCILTGTKVPAIRAAPIPSRRRSTPSHWLLWSQRGWISNCKKPSPSGGRWPSLARPDEGCTCCGCPFAGNHGEAAPHQPPAGGSFPQGGSQRILKGDVTNVHQNPGHQPRLHLHQGRRVRGRDPVV
jgi:phosphate butyryltransferase